MGVMGLLGRLKEEHREDGDQQGSFESGIGVKEESQEQYPGEQQSEGSSETAGSWGNYIRGANRRGRGTGRGRGGGGGFGQHWQEGGYGEPPAKKANTGEEGQDAYGQYQGYGYGEGEQAEGTQPPAAPVTAAAPVRMPPPGWPPHPGPPPMTHMPPAFPPPPAHYDYYRTEQQDSSTYDDQWREWYKQYYGQDVQSETTPAAAAPPAAPPAAPAPPVPAPPPAAPAKSIQQQWEEYNAAYYQHYGYYPPGASDPATTGYGVIAEQPAAPPAVPQPSSQTATSTFASEMEAYSKAYAEWYNKWYAGSVTSAPTAPTPGQPPLPSSEPSQPPPPPPTDDKKSRWGGFAPSSTPETSSVTTQPPAAPAPTPPTWPQSTAPATAAATYGQMATAGQMSYGVYPGYSYPGYYG